MAPRKPGAGPKSRISRQQILDAARKFYEDGVTQTALAKLLGLSSSYTARMIHKAREDGWLRVRVESDLVPTQTAAESVVAERKAQVAVAHDGSWLSVAVDTKSAEPSSQTITIGSTIVTITVTRKPAVTSQEL